MLISEIETAIDAPKMRVYTALVRLKKYGFIQSSVRASDKPKEGRCPKRYASTDKNGAYVQDRTKKAAFRGSAVIAYLRKYGDGKTLSQIANGLHLNKELVSSLLQSMKKRGMIITEKKITGGEYSFYSYAGGVVTVNNRAHLLYSINPSYED
jgi:predicted transcriptional regulator